MMTTAIAILALGATQKAEAPSAGKIISGMLAHYSQLHSVVGTIKYTIEAKAPTGSVSKSVETDIQYERPNKLFLHQVLGGSDPKQWLVTSDGKMFSYPTPPEIIHRSKSKRLVENVLGNTIADIYGASVSSVIDRSAPLGIAVSWTPELRRIVAEWPVYQLAGEIDWKGQKVWKITGKYRESPAGAIVGDFALVIDKGGNVLEYKTTEAYATPIDATKLDTKNLTYVINTWMVDLAANGTPEPSLFKLVT